MTPLSKEFAPPLRLIAPFFQVGSIFYLLSMISLLFFHPVFTYQQFSIAGWVHLFLLGYVMIIIFGAMAQLIPVVLEVEHAAVDLYYVILPILIIGVLMMVSGFWWMPALLPYGGLLVLVAMTIFAAESIATLYKSPLKNFTVSTIQWGNSFLFIGILSGLAVAFGMSGAWSIDISVIIKAHVFGLLGGYIFVTIMGLSMILLPMFSLAHGFDQKAVHLALKLVISGVVIVFVGSISKSEEILFTGYLVTTAGSLFYIRQVHLIAKNIVRKEFDIWLKSIIFAFIALAMAIILSVVYFVTNNEALLHAAVWFLITGFISFFILGHLYKIIPFLVWFERFSPLVGKQKVPMLHEMYPKLGASMMFWFTSGGVMIAGLGLMFESATIFKGGVSWLCAGALFLVITIYQMLSYGVNK